jgi:hypothetical protein
MNDPIPVLTLHQPHATLIAIGAKTIETRGQAFRSLVGQRIAIHAAARRFGINSTTADVVRSFPRETYRLLRDVLGVDIEETYVPPAGLRVPGKGYPLGAIVCMATVTASLPMVAYTDLPNVWPPEHGCIFHNPLGGLMLAPGEYRPVEKITDQLPYGDFRPGRFGLILADVEPLAEPVQFKGGQGLSRRWTPT